MRTPSIYSLNSFQIYHTAMLTSHHVIHHISNTYLSYNGEFVPFDRLHSAPHPPLYA